MKVMMGRNRALRSTFSISIGTWWFNFYWRTP